MFASWSLELSNFEFFGKNLFLNEMTINFNMHSSSMKHHIGGYMKSFAWLSQHNFTYWMSLNFNSWRRYLIQTSAQVAVHISLYSTSARCSNILLFTLPRDNIPSNRYTIPQNTAFVNRRACPTYITISFVLIVNPLSWCLLVFNIL